MPQADPTAEESEAWVREIRKGETKLAALCLLARGDSYGYAILEALRSLGNTTVMEGNLYPALHALEAAGFVRSYWRDAEAKGLPRRRYYRITPEGRRLLSRMDAAWRGHRAAIDTLLSFSRGSRGAGA